MAVNYWNPHTFNLPKRLASVTTKDILNSQALEYFKLLTKPWAEEVLALRLNPKMKRTQSLNIGYVGPEVAEIAWACCLKYLHERNVEAYALFNSTIEEDMKDEAFRVQCFRSPVLGVFGIGSLRSLSFQAQSFLKSVLEARFYGLRPTVLQANASSNASLILGVNTQDHDGFFKRLFSEAETTWVDLS